MQISAMGTSPIAQLAAGCGSQAAASNHGDDAVLPHALRRKTQHQGVEPTVAAGCTRPDELALVQPARGQPDADAVVHQHLDPVGRLVGKEVCGFRMRCAKDLDHAGQRGVGACAHVQR